jgi:hypothetical protein
LAAQVVEAGNFNARDVIEIANIVSVVADAIGQCSNPSRNDQRLDSISNRISRGGCK